DAATGARNADRAVTAGARTNCPRGRRPGSRCRRPGRPGMRTEKRCQDPFTSDAGKGPDTFFLSIVIPSRQRVDLLRYCLTSVVQNAPPATEIIVVDDGSDGAAVSLTALDFPGVRVVRLPRSRGFCFAANRGIEAASGPFIQLLNDDTQVSPG